MKPYYIIADGTVNLRGLRSGFRRIWADVSDNSHMVRVLFTERQKRARMVPRWRWEQLKAVEDTGQGTEAALAALRTIRTPAACPIRVLQPKKETKQ